MLDYLRNVAGGNKRQTAAHFNIDRKSIYDFLKIEGKLYSSPGERFRVEYERIGRWPELDERLYDYFKSERLKKRLMTRGKLERGTDGRQCFYNVRHQLPSQ